MLLLPHSRTIESDDPSTVFQFSLSDNDFYFGILWYGSPSDGSTGAVDVSIHLITYSQFCVVFSMYMIHNAALYM